MKDKFISPSIMCARDLLNIKSDLDIFLKQSIKYIHVDIMDNSFVPNLTFGPDIVNSLVEYRNKKHTDFIIDLHLMINDPISILPRMNISKSDIVTLHGELPEPTITETISWLHENNIKTGIAINPKTDVDILKKYIDDIDLVLIMFVEPGFKGARPVPKIINKVKRTKDILMSYNKYDDIIISVDGGISPERAKECSERGASIFVGGTSSIYNNNNSSKKLTNNNIISNIELLYNSVINNK